MLIYEDTKINFMRCVDQDEIAKTIEKNIYEKMGRKTPKAEFRAFENSLNYMYRVVNDSDIPGECGIAIEYNIPQTAKRVDFIISGYNKDNNGACIVVELKQWESINLVDGKDALVETYLGGGLRTVVHPSYQAWSYTTFINDYNASVQDKEIELQPCACLHNYQRKANDPIDDSRYSEYTQKAPIYSKGQISELREFIKKYICRGDNKEILYVIDKGKIRPSKNLQNCIASMMKGNQEFVMIDDQKVAYETILNTSLQCQKDGKKRTVIVEGGPGTGKSVIAINLLSELTQRGQLVQYATKNAAPKNVYMKKLQGAMSSVSIKNMFKSSGNYIESPSNSIATILSDESHRLNKKSGIYQNLGENQIKEIINASLCSVFFIDESQRVTIKDIGSIDEIKRWANDLGSEISYLELISQFRCNGSDGYLSWLDNTLEIRETANYSLEEIDYDFKIFDSANKLRKAIIDKNNTNHNSRLVAGYCWDWIKTGKNDSSVYDIIIDDFKMSWNLGSGEPFATSDTSINEVGCIHTTQGLEFDYVGVIIGDDIRYEDGRIVTDFTKRARTDQSLKGIKTMYDKDPDKANRIADEIIKNTYRTLMTRGMKGCYVYCTNKALSDYIKSRLEFFANEH